MLKITYLLCLYNNNNNNNNILLPESYIDTCPYIPKKYKNQENILQHRI